MAHGAVQVAEAGIKACAFIRIWNNAPDGMSCYRRVPGWPARAPRPDPTRLLRTRRNHSPRRTAHCYL